MNKLISIDLTNVVYFKKAHLPIENSNYVVIQGHNEDALDAKDVSNGAGKSLSMSVLPNCIYQASPLSTRKKAKGDMLTKTSVISIVFRHHDGRYIKIDQHPSSFKIYERQKDTAFTDKDDLQIRTVPLAETWIEQNFLISKTEFYSYCYIQAQVSLDFQVGTPSARLDFITKLFRLDSFDVLASYFRKEVQRIDKEQTRFSVMEAEYQKVNEQSIKINWCAKDTKTLGKLAESISVLETRVESDIAKLQRLTAKETAYLSLLPFLEERKELLAKYPSKLALDDFIDYLQEQSDLIREHEDYQKQIHVHDKAILTIREDITVLKEYGEYDKDNVTSRLLVHTSLLEEKQSMLGDLEDTYEERKLLAEDIRALKMQTAGQVKTDNRDIDVDLALVNTTLHLAELCKHGQDTCPTCLQDIDIKSVKQLVKKAKKKKVELQKYKIAQQQQRQLAELRTKIKEFPNDMQTQVREGRAQLAKQEKKQHDLTKLLSNIKDYHYVVRQFKKMMDNKPIPPDNKPDIGKDTLDKHLALVSDIEHVVTTIRVLTEENNIGKQPEVESRKCKRSLTKAKVRYRKNSARLKKDSARYNKLHTRNVENDLVTANLARLKKDMSKVLPLIKQQHINKALVHAYSSKGLKLNVASKGICSSLQTNFNRYSSLLFNENFKFSIALRNGIEVSVDRGNNVISDVRLLSGAETKCFRLLFLVSILPLVPPERRLNTVILDEVDSNMDAPTQQRFINEFLPLLRTVVPNVIIITPMDIEYAGAQVWTVNKKNGVSKVIIDKG